MKGGLSGGVWGTNIGRLIEPTGVRRRVDFMFGLNTHTGKIDFCMVCCLYLFSLY